MDGEANSPLVNNRCHLKQSLLFPATVYNYDRKRNFSNTLSRVFFLNYTVACSCGRLKTEPNFFRPIFIPKSKMADILFTLLSFMLGLTLKLSACFQLNLSLQAIPVECLRRRGDIIRQIVLSLSKLIKAVKTTC